MNVFLTGGTGFIGSAILTALVAEGHHVTALVRSANAATRVAATGATALLGDITDTAWLSAHLSDVDGAIHAASPGDESSALVDRSIANAVVAAFSGASKPYIHTGGVWVRGPGNDITEDTPFAAPALVAWRGAIEAIVLDADVAASVIEPALVYGHGRGIPTMLSDAPRTASGQLTTLGDGTQHWSTVHVDDLAELYVTVLDRGDAVGRIIGASGSNPTVGEISAALAGAPVVPEGVEASRTRLGEALADALLMSQQASGAKARSLGWTPQRPTLLQDILTGSDPTQSGDRGC